MPHPSYLLNPGDMFQVDPDMVMLATGKQKGNLTELQRKQGKKGPYIPKAEAAAAEREEGEASEDAAAEEGESAEAAEAADPEAKAEVEASAVKQKRGDLKKLLETAKTIVAMDKDLGVKRKQKLRAFQQELKKVISQSGRASVTSDQIPVEHLTEVLNQLSIVPHTAASVETPSKHSTSETIADDIQAAFAAVSEERKLSTPERKRFDAIMQEYRENPHDESKPYRTPWEPRPWMAPFAFIPRYLEVNQNICSAVYLRHPVARQGHSEVPTPFPEMLGQLSFNWYLRRR